MKFCPLQKGDCVCDLIWKYVVIKAILYQGEAEAHHRRRAWSVTEEGCGLSQKKGVVRHRRGAWSFTDEGRGPSQKKGVGKGVKENEHLERNAGDPEKAIRTI